MTFKLSEKVYGPKMREFILVMDVKEFIKLKENLVLELDQGHITYHEYVEKSIKLAGSLK